MGKFEIRVLPDLCTVCLRCMLACSESHTARFSLPASRIRGLLESCQDSDAGKADNRTGRELKTRVEAV